MRRTAKSDVKFQVLDVECRPFLKSSKNQCESRSVPPSQFVKHQQKQHVLERSYHLILGLYHVWDILHLMKCLCLGMFNNFFAQVGRVVAQAAGANAAAWLGKAGVSSKTMTETETMTNKGKDE